MTRPELVIAETPATAAALAAGRIADALAEAIAARGVAHWATTGGSSAPPLYEVLSRPPVSTRVDWSRVHVWWGDDRYVPVDHPLSNALPFEQVMLRAGRRATGTGGQPGVDPDGVVIPNQQVHVMPMAAAIASGGGTADAARAYEAELRRAGPEPDPDGWPRFDLLLLGIGPDGHLLSVFPGSPAWDAVELVVAIPAPTHVEPHVERVTLHPAVVGAARRVLVVATGGAKADVLARALRGDASPRELPAAAAAHERATWVLDRPAAGRIDT
ncbi:MAG TPA: 6-phosphogluconolactonase [Candidatus Limnocylindrales bacterium]|nr:6-phosphogluconolactonase [Candidatus Limnocylindrales bacterium]